MLQWVFEVLFLRLRIMFPRLDVNLLYSHRWPWTFNISASSPEWLQKCTTTPGFRRYWEIQTQSLVYSRQSLFQLSHIPSNGHNLKTTSWTVEKNFTCTNICAIQFYISIFAGFVFFGGVGDHVLKRQNTTIKEWISVSSITCLPKCIWLNQKFFSFIMPIFTWYNPLC